MYLSRAHSRFLALLAVVLFMGGVLASGWFAGGKEPLSRESGKSTALENETTAPATAGNSELPAADTSSRFMLQNFQRSEVKDGKKLWEIIAPAGQYNPGEHTAAVINANLSVYKKDGTRIEFNAEKAEIRFEGSNLAWAKALNAVRINYADELSIEGTQAIYDRAKELVTSDQPVTIKTERLLVSGDSLRADLTTREIFIQKNVKTTILPLKRRK